jgi:hypothetical protein
MTKILCIWAIIITSILSVKAQDEFVPGAYTDLSGALQEGLISLDGERSTPQSFLFKKEFTDEATTITKNEARSFRITSSIENRKFIVKPILIYESSDKFDKLNNQREVDFSKKDLFILRKASSQY